MLFARAIRNGEPIKVFNHGRHSRSFTYIDDIVEGAVRTLDRLARPNPEWNGRARPGDQRRAVPHLQHRHERPVQLLHFIELLEQAFDRKAVMEMLPLQPGDVPDTEADTSELIAATGYAPRVSIEEGVGCLRPLAPRVLSDAAAIPRHA